MEDPARPVPHGSTAVDKSILRSSSRRLRNKHLGVTVLFLYALVFVMALSSPRQLASQVSEWYPTQNLPPNALPAVGHNMTAPPPPTLRQPKRTPGSLTAPSEARVPFFRAEHCDHSCLQMRWDTALDGEGNVVGGCRSDDIRKSRALVLTMFEQTNPHHAVHEDYFPLAYQVRNCLLPGTDVYCRMCTNIHLLSGIFGTALQQWVQGRGSGESSWMGSGQHEIGRRLRTCYKEVHVVLNPLRTPCVEDPMFKYALGSKLEPHYVGTRGLGLRVKHYADRRRSYRSSSVSGEIRGRSFDILRSYLELQHNFSFQAVDNLDAVRDEPVSIVIVTRGEDVVKRRQTNSGMLRRRILQKHRNARVSIVDFGDGMGKIEQLAKLNRADVVIAVHGGGLGNMVGMRPGSLVVSQCCKSKCKHWEWDLAPLLGVKLAQIDYFDHESSDAPVVDFMVDHIIEALRPHLSSRGYRNESVTGSLMRVQ